MDGKTQQRWSGSTDPDGRDGAPTEAGIRPPRTRRARLAHGFSRWRGRLQQQRPGFYRIYRLSVGAVGTLVLAVGLITIPYPGPGWLTVFLGLGILASEFSWAMRVLRVARSYYDAWTAWMARQNLVVKGTFAFLTAVVVVATLWLLGTYALIGGWLGLEWPWLASPLL